MPTYDAWTEAFAGGIGKDELRDVLKAGAPLVVASASVANGLTLSGVNCLIVGGIPFQLDPVDTTSAHDGVSVIVSADGYRFKPGQPAFIPSRVLSQTNTPPGSPAIGDAYIVGAAPSGAWASNANNLALYTSRGWVFVSTSYLAGRIVYNVATDSSWQYSDSGWRNGIGSLLVTDIVKAKHLASSITRVFSIVNQTTNTPPGSPADQVAYVVGPSPTGAWAGKATQVAIYEDAAWVFHVPSEGDTVWDQALDREFKWSGSVWYSPLADNQNFPRVAHAYATVGAAKTVTGVSNSSSAPYQYLYLSGTAPTTDGRRVSFTEIEVTIAATASTKKLVFEFDGFDIAQFDTGAFFPTVAVFRDSDASAIAWNDYRYTKGRLFALSDDAASHTYRFAIMVLPTLGTATSILKNANFSVKEASA